MMTIEKKRAGLSPFVSLSNRRQNASTVILTARATRFITSTPETVSTLRVSQDLNEWRLPTDCQLLSIEKSMPYRRVGGCVSMCFPFCQAMKNRIRGRVTDRIECYWGFC